MDKDIGYKTERTKTEIDVIHKEINHLEDLGDRPKQLCAKDTSHGRVSEMLIKGDGITKANVLYRPDKVMSRKELSAVEIPEAVVHVDWKRKVIAANIIERNERAKEIQSLGKGEPLNTYATQVIETQENQEGESWEQEIINKPQEEIYYSPTLPPSPPAVSPIFIYQTSRYKNISDILPGRKTENGKKEEKVTGKNAKQDKQEKKYAVIDKKRISSQHPSYKQQEINPPVLQNGGILTQNHDKKSHPFADKARKNLCIRTTSCHDGRKLSRNFVKQDTILFTLPGRNVKQLKIRIKGRKVLGTEKAGIKRQSIVGVKDICAVKPRGQIVSCSYSWKHNNEGKSFTSCHDGRKLAETNIEGQGDLGTTENTTTSDKMHKGRKRVKSILCESYRGLKKTGSATVSTGRKVVATTAAVTKSVSNLSEDGSELPAVSGVVFMATDAVSSKVSNKHAEKKTVRMERKYEKKKDKLLEKKIEIKQFIEKKKSDGTPLSKDERIMLEKKLGIVNKRNKGEQHVSDKRNRKLQKMEKANGIKIKRTENKLKNTPKKTQKDLRRRNVSAQMKFQARSYAIRKMMATNGDTEGTGIGGMLFSLIKTGGIKFSQNTFKAIGRLLLKIVAPILPAILAIVIVPILCLLLIGGIAGGHEESQAQAQAQETVPGLDYDTSSLEILYGHANSTITGDVNIMKWKADIKRELIKQGIDKSWTDMTLCMMWQESKGMGSDIMQSGGATPKDSIRAGISVLKAALAKCAQYKSTDIKLVLYCYNYGPGFADYIYKEWDGVCSEEAAQARTNAMLASHPEWNVYGDPKYAQHVLQNYVFEENPDLKPDSSKWCENDKNNVSKCTLTSITSYACKFIGNKYVWGGDSLTNGCDCSGFTQQVYKHFGIDIPRTSSEQSLGGRKVNSLSEAKPGDLLFYAEDGTVHHVALYLGNNTVVHASNSQPYPAGGIKTTNPANYRPIVAIRRYSK